MRSKIYVEFQKPPHVGYMKKIWCIHPWLRKLERSSFSWVSIVDLRKFLYYLSTILINKMDFFLLSADKRVIRELRYDENPLLPMNHIHYNKWFVLCQMFWSRSNVFRDADWLTKFSQKNSKVLAIFFLALRPYTTAIDEM